MKIRIDCNGGVLCLSLSGELDHHAAAGAMREIDGILDKFMPVDCVLELSRLSFMDSSGIAMMLRIHKRMELLGGHLAVVNAAPQPQRVLDASGIDRLVRVISSEKESVG